MQHSIRFYLKRTLLWYIAAPLLLCGGLLIWQSYVVQLSQALQLQAMGAKLAVTHVVNFMIKLEDELRLTVQLQNLLAQDRSTRYTMLSKLLLANPIYAQLTLLDHTGQEVVRVSRRTAVTVNDLVSRSQAEEFLQPLRSGVPYFSPVVIDETTGEPLMLVAVPVVDARSGLVAHVLVANIRLQQLWDEIADINVGQSGNVYIVNQQGRLLAHRNPSLVLRGTHVTLPTADGIQPGLTDWANILVSKTFLLGEQKLTVITEHALAEAMPLTSRLVLAVATYIIVNLLAVFQLERVAVRLWVTPIERLATTAQAIAAGDLTQRAPIHATNELAAFAQAFNTMTAALQGSLVELQHHRNDLEVLVEARTVALRKTNHQLEQQIVERKQAEEALVEKANELARSNIELERFAYVASHDLQEPLRMVSSYVQLLAQRYQGQLDEDADEFIAYAIDGTRRMQMLINDLLTYSRISTHGKKFAATNCAEILQQVEAMLELTIEETGAIIDHDPLPTVWADRTQMVQLFQNLIGNAIKFHNGKPPHIQIQAKLQKNEWLFAVQDNGIGIDPQFSERIFVIFQRLHNKEDYPGTGIGLALCKKIVERHGGRIWVESNSGHGATFYFTLPVSQPAENLLRISGSS